MSDRILARCGLVALAGSILLVTSGCSSVGSTVDAGALSESTSAALPFSSAPVPSPSFSVEPFQPNFNTWTARGTNKESVPITATIELDPHVYRWEDIATSDAYSALASTCGGVDEKRDAVMVASISAVADNNGFDTDAGVVVGFLNKDGLVGDPYNSEYAQFSPSRIEFAVGYTDPACSATKNAAPLFGVGMNVLADPDGGSTGAWGPVPVLFIMRDYYGPTRPKANPQMSKFLQYAVFGIANGAPYDPIYGGTGSDVIGIWNATETTGPGKKGEMPRGLLGLAPGGAYFRLDRSD